MLFGSLFKLLYALPLPPEASPTRGVALPHLGKAFTDVQELKQAPWLPFVSVFVVPAYCQDMSKTSTAMILDLS